MEFKTDLMDGLRHRVFPDSTVMPDSAFLAWPVLHARLAAAHAAAQALANQQGGQSIRCGGFNNWTTAIQAQSNPSMTVNPADLADGKREQGNAGAIAGKTLTGDRGQ